MKIQIKHVEEHTSGGTCEITVSIKQAIELQKKAHTYTSDLEALMGYVVSHWAIFVDYAGNRLDQEQIWEEIGRML